MKYFVMCVSDPRYCKLCMRCSQCSSNLPCFVRGCSRVVRPVATGPPNIMMGLRCTILAHMARQGNLFMGSPAQTVLPSVTCTGR